MERYSFYRQVPTVDIEIKGSGLWVSKLDTVYIFDIDHWFKSELWFILNAYGVKFYQCEWNIANILHLTADSNIFYWLRVDKP